MEAPRTLPEGVNFSYIFSFIGVTHSHFRALDLARRISDLPNFFYMWRRIDDAVEARTTYSPA